MPKILIVEDEAVVAWDIQETLEKFGYKVLATVTSGTEAIQIIDAIKPNIILMDIVLEEDMDGITAAQQIRDRYDIPIIYLTAYADNPTWQRAIKTNPYGYIIKPFQEKHLQTTIEIALNRHQQQKYLEQGKQLVGVIAQQIRHSVRLYEIFNTTAIAIRQLFQIERVIVSRFNPDGTGAVVVESIATDATPLLGWEGNNVWIAQTNESDCRHQSQIQVIDDIHTIKLHPQQLHCFDFFGIKSQLSIPLLKGKNYWGMLICYDCTAPRNWQQWQIELLEQIANELGNAIQHTELSEQLERANQQLQNLRFIDYLTQLSSRNYFDEALAEEWEKLALEQVPLCLIFADIDFFNTFNHSYGHQAGDDCLRQVASAIQKSISRPTNLVSRYGGEEFMIMLPRTNANAGVWIAQRIRGIVKRLKITHAKSPVHPYLTLSFGVASTIPNLKSSPRILVAAADQAAYQAKAEGGDRVVIGKLPQL